MSERNTHLLISDIASSIQKILEYTQGMSYEEYENDSRTKDAVVRNFEIIGETTSLVPEEFEKSCSLLNFIYNNKSSSI